MNKKSLRNLGFSLLGLMLCAGMILAQSVTPTGGGSTTPVLPNLGLYATTNSLRGYIATNAVAATVQTLNTLTNSVNQLFVTNQTVRGTLQVQTLQAVAVTETNTTVLGTNTVTVLKFSGDNSVQTTAASGGMAFTNLSLVFTNHAGFGSSNTSIPYASGVEVDNGGLDLTYSNGAVLGLEVYVNHGGLYEICDQPANATNPQLAVTTNASPTQCKAAPSTITGTPLRIIYSYVVGTGISLPLTRTIYCPSNCVIRPHRSAGDTITDVTTFRFSVQQVARE
jgi:hypothetical protein